METSRTIISEPKTSQLESKYNILYVDDEEANLRIFKYAFKRDYNIFLALNGNEALDIIKENEIHLIITDQKMPIMTGVDLLKKVVPKNPKIIRMIMSGFSDVGVIIDAVNEIGINKYLKKPWDRSDLKMTLDQELERSYGVSDIHVNEEGLLVEDDVVQESINFVQKTLNSGNSQIERIFPQSFQIAHYPNEVVNDVYWGREINSHQKLAVLLNNHVKGNVGGIVSLALSNMVSSVVDSIETKEPSQIAESILTQYEQSGLIAYQEKFGTKDLGVSVLLIDDFANTIAFHSNYSGIKFFDNENEEILRGRLSGKLALNELKRVYLFTQSFNNCCSGDLIYAQLINESIEMDLEKQDQFLRAEIDGPSAFKGISDLTLIGLDLSVL